MEGTIIDSETDAWLASVAKMNGCTIKDVLDYLDALSSTRKVIHHLKLV